MQIDFLNFITTLLITLSDPFRKLYLIQVVKISWRLSLSLSLSLYIYIYMFVCVC